MICRFKWLPIELCGWAVTVDILNLLLAQLLSFSNANVNLGSTTATAVFS